MPESAIAPLISGILAVVGSFVGNYAMSLKKSREDAIKEAEREQAQKDQIESIKKRLDDHNHYAEKFAKNSEKLADVDIKLAQLQKDVEYLKSDRCKA